MLFAVFAIAAIASFGNAAIWIYCNNRYNALGLPHWALKPLSKIFDLAVVLGPLVLTWGAYTVAARRQAGVMAIGDWLFCGYLAICALVAIFVTPWVVFRRRQVRPPAVLLSNHTTSLDLRTPFGDELIGAGRFRQLLKAGWNESLTLEVNEKRLHIADLHPALEGLRIAHLSDLHFTGHITRKFFDEIVEQTNALRPDLVAITGDLIDKSPLIDWIPDTLGRLKADAGTYYVLGNHDRRIDTRRLVETLNACGLVSLRGVWRSLEIAGQPVILAGNELPWFGPAADMTDCPREEAGQRPLRVLLSHSPDQFPWATRHGFDLMLAGHTHGGQIRFPVIGPVVSPSLYGVRYASGTFHMPPMVLHVSRGLSGKTPVRLNCPPELALLVLCGE